MFTGIVESIGTVQGVHDLGGGRRIRVGSDLATDLKVDQSISVNGVCLTVVDLGAESFDVIAVEETLSKTSTGSLSEGSRVNLERAITPSTRLDGHLVQGHVDATGTVEEVVEQTTGRLFTISFDSRFAPYLIPTGSIAVDGISLTVARLGEKDFTVAIIPYTYDHTIASEWRAGTRVNLEFDLIGKYVARWLERSGDSSAPDNVSMDLLRRSGFIE